MPTPRKWAQTMLARFLANYGFSAEASHSASTSRRYLSLSSGVRAAEELRLHVLFGDRVLGLAAFVEDDAFARIFRGFASDLGEERGEAVVIVHRPAVEGMVVALGALDAHAHEDLGGVFGELEHVLLDLEVVGGRVGEGAAFRGEHLADELVERHVAGDAFAQPLVVVESGFVGDLLRAVVEGADLQELGPFHHPHFGEFFAFEQFIDEGGAFVRAGVGEKPGALLHAWAAGRRHRGRRGGGTPRRTRGRRG